MDQITTEFNNDLSNNDNSVLLLKQCLVLLDKYNNCLTVMYNNCKCDQNIEIKLLFNDLLSKYKSIITNHKTFIETTNTLEHNYCKFGRLLANDLCEDINKDNETVVNECIIEPNIEENENNVNIDLSDNNNNTNDNNLTQNNQTINEQNSEENANITENVNQNFGYISKNLLINEKIDSITDNKQEILKVKKKSAIRSNNIKSRVKSKKTQTKKELKTNPKTDKIDNDLYNSTKFDRTVIIPQLITAVTNELFECDKCLQFIRIEDRVIHYKSLHNLFMDPITIDKCYICELEFTKRSDFIAHNKELHYMQPFKCEKSVYGKVCGRVYNHFKDLTKHVKKVHCRDRPFKCSQCDRDYPLLSQLNMHRKKFHSEKKFVCDWNDCDYTTFENYLLDKHKKRHLKPKITRTPKVESDNNEKLFKCSDCGKEYKLLDSLNGHRNQVHLQHKYVCDWKDCQYSTSTKRRIILHKKRHLNVKTVCCDWPGCDSSFVDKWDLYLHRTRHSDCKFCCPHCNREFKRNQSLKKHVLVAHTNERPFECSQCLKKYATKSLLTKHVKCSHTTKQFKCDNCDYKSNNKTHLNIHNRRVHLLERTYRCDVIGCEQRRFFGKKELFYHQMSAHNDERRFVCDWPECGAAFKLKENLTAHVKCHTGTNVSRKKKAVL